MLRQRKSWLEKLTDFIFWGGVFYTPEEYFERHPRERLYVDPNGRMFTNLRHPVIRQKIAEMQRKWGRRR